MNSDLKQFLFFIAFILFFGGLQGLLNVIIISWWFLGIVAFIIITFHKKDLLIVGFKILFAKKSKN
jgi:hypothetical protein